jgi:signal transduction histidine kinase
LVLPQNTEKEERAITQIENTTNGQAARWIKYEYDSPGTTDDEKWLGILGIRSFRLLLFATLISLLFLIVRHAVFYSTLPWADVGTAAIIGGILWLVFQKPQYYTLLSWLVLASLFLDVADGLYPWPQPITATHLLLPILVLYGALLCDIAITTVTMLGVLGICTLTWLKFPSMTIDEKMMLSNVVLATLVSGLTGLGVWMHHRGVMRIFRQQAAKLLRELETNNRLHAFIFHDIANPLTALIGTLNLAQKRGSSKTGELSMMERNAGRIDSIIKIVRSGDANILHREWREEVTMDRIAEDLLEVFSSRLNAKQQTFSFTTGSGLRTKTIYDVLLNSVLANLVANAIKFSPPGSRIEMLAKCEGKNLRIEIRDEGSGFTPEFLMRGGQCPHASSVGTAGETGYGLGLSIVALYVSKLGGTLEIMNRLDGRGAASVVLPEN